MALDWSWTAFCVGFVFHITPNRLTSKIASRHRDDLLECIMPNSIEPDLQSKMTDGQPTNANDAPFSIAAHKPRLFCILRAISRRREQ